jgi:hypothetical protein
MNMGCTPASVRCSPGACWPPGGLLLVVGSGRELLAGHRLTWYGRPGGQLGSWREGAPEPAGGEAPGRMQLVAVAPGTGISVALASGGQPQLPPPQTLGIGTRLSECSMQRRCLALGGPRVFPWAAAYMWSQMHAAQTSCGSTPAAICERCWCKTPTCMLASVAWARR